MLTTTEVLEWKNRHASERVEFGYLMSEMMPHLMGETRW